MKSIKLIAVVMAAVMSFAACQKGEPSSAPSNPASNNILKVGASVYNFTKATDTAFETNDEIGLYMYKGSETYAENHKYTFNAGSFTTDEDIVWYSETEVVANITAYHPYNENAYNGEFTVNADQSSLELYKASDLLLALAQSAPTEEVVVLPFKHALSKITVSFDNQLNDEIADVFFTDLLGKVALNLNNASVAATGEAGTIKALKSGANTWQLIVAPQTASPKLAVTTASGKQYTFILEEEVTFSAGKVSAAENVVLSTESIYTSFTPEIEDWVADNELNFSQNKDENVDLPNKDEGENLIYLKPHEEWFKYGEQNNDWFFAAYFFGNGETWVKLEDAGNGYYKCSLPTGYTSVIFVQMYGNKTLEDKWDAKKNQTVDLTIPTDGKNLFTIENPWNENSEWKATGTWSVK